VVWKATTSIGCGRADRLGLEGSDRVNYLVVCQYYAAGSIANPGFFADNVGETVSGTLSVGIPARSQPTTGSGSGGSNPASGNEAQESGCEPMKDDKKNILKIVLALLTAGTPLVLSVIV
jgi:hypothetical protein